MDAFDPRRHNCIFSVLLFFCVPPNSVGTPVEIVDDFEWSGKTSGKFDRVQKIN